MSAEILDNAWASDALVRHARAGCLVCQHEVDAAAPQRPVDPAVDWQTPARLVMAYRQVLGPDL